MEFFCVSACYFLRFIRILNFPESLIFAKITKFQSFYGIFLIFRAKYGQKILKLLGGSVFKMKYNYLNKRKLSKICVLK